MSYNLGSKNIVALGLLGACLGACSDASPSLALTQNTASPTVTFQCGIGHNGSEGPAHTFKTSQPDSLRLSDWTVKQYNANMKITSMKPLIEDEETKGYSFYIKYGVAAGGDIGLTLELDTSLCSQESKAVLIKRNVGGFAAGVIIKTHECTCENWPAENESEPNSHINSL